MRLSALGLISLTLLSVAACSSSDDTSSEGPEGSSTDAGNTTDGSPNAATYSLGGTVAGLSGTGLVLTTGTEDLAIGATGAFKFATKLATGTAYAVTVKTQPTGPSQSCKVTNGTGTIGSTDVSSIAINCGTDTFTVGGTATGLAGTVVLQDNGGDDLSLAANAPFTFAKPVASGSPYAVTVKTQPTVPVQNCVVTGGSGTVAASPITNVQLACTTTKFKVKAAVTGLTGTLVLQNKAADDLSFSVDATKEFAVPVASGASYAVTVKTQPAGQLCSIAAGSGSITNADVTVAVTCATAYSVGGTIVDLLGPLTGAGMVLQNNAAGDLNIAAGGPFTFTLPLLDAAPYAVTVKTQPSNPTRVCTTSNGAGNIAAANVTNVFVTCGWGAIPAFPGGADVAVGTGQGAAYGQMAFDEKGDILFPPGSGASVVKLVRATGLMSTIGGAFPGGTFLGIAYDPATKKAYIGRTSPGELWTYDLANPATPAVKVASLPGGAHTLAIAPAGFGAFGGFIVAAMDNSNVVFIDPANPATQTSFPAGNIANGLAFASDKTFYVELNNGTIVKMSPTGVTTPFANVGSGTDGIALDEGRGLMYVASSGTSSTNKVKLSDGTFTTVAGTIPYDGGYWPSPILFDGNSTLIVGVNSGGIKVRQQTVP